MRKLIFSLLLLPFLGKSQEVQKVKVVRDDEQLIEFFDSFGPNELRIDPLELLIYPAFDVTYEHFKDTYSAFGVSLFLNLGDAETIIDWSEIISVTPFYRFYFFNKKDFGGSGLFVEGFAKFSLARQYLDYYYYDEMLWSENFVEQTETGFDMALGAGFGQKWVNKHGFTFELSFGVGRFLLGSGSEDYYSDGTVSVYTSERTVALRGGFSIGKRF